MNQENIHPLRKYTSNDILIALTYADGGFRIDVGDGLKDAGNIRDERSHYSESDLLNAKDNKIPLDIKETESNNGQKSLSIYFPSYDVNRSMAVSYTSINIIIPDQIDISSFKDSFINELTNKFYELDLFQPSEENHRRISGMVKELSDFAKQLFADKINQSNKTDNQKLE